MSEKSCITINCGCCGGGSGNKEDGAPVGTVISYMGTKAPEHYLVCDGAVINIADYPYLAEQIKDEFGAVDYFGGDGTSTFAVPDLRNKFLRGYHGEAEKQLSGEIGEQQKSTDHILFDKRGETDENGVLQIGVLKEQVLPQNIDDMVLKTTDSDGIYISQFSPSVSQISSKDKLVGCFYNSRPTNVAVLYCIKYE
ncbi:tail fiber protein [Hungatella sp. L12]|uniref:Tail fiber protein n=1 Tax=Hungatella hominis TaxID=2763050 RepID=A0ABR7HH24_9FIRM|nr:phage tail protein [Hungatella hominis]MBC5712469.1 tail fiber protein [Hungatella hominis]